MVVTDIFLIFAETFIGRMRMIKNILTLFIAVLMVIAAPAGAVAAMSPYDSFAIEQADDDGISITVNQSTIYITGAAGQTLQVVSLTGKQVLTVKIESPAQRVELNVPKGCYILKIGKVVRKVSIR